MAAACISNLKLLVRLPASLRSFPLPSPHVQIYFDVKEQNGEVRNYAMTIRWTPPVLRKLGWTRKSIKPGDTLTVTYRPHKNSPVAGAIITLAVNGEPLQTEPEA